ncbi:Nif3-like dinuclear metal center hexameric protein [Spiroplasma chinense]|uniref:GTP cyclohydrolase 1 type 2 homolog n=1 Tax=Spiroplasma chinense TaxID=216932 RepID=A0A5B9Y5E7_9MOLU|nr:Nif3-like dinuclear metal center hexameric protein [Spiroplasma chinense]QEH62045.1 Nif3-like dinuclear metal center hexameric protein [Spiroplasma chinense]
MAKIKANSLINYLNDLFPQSAAADWDKVGLQIEEVYNLESQDEIEKVVICLDLTKEVVEKAIEINSNFIISRHPFLFGEVEEELKDLAKKEIYDLLLENEIQVFSIHTNYDNSPNNNLIDLLETQFNIKSTDSVGEFNEGYKIKFLRDISIKEIVDKLKFIFGKQNSLLTKNTDMEKMVDRIYLTPGSGADTMKFLQLKDVMFVTGEAKWHEWLYADQNKIDMFTLGHYMENHFIDDIKVKLFKTFGDDLVVCDFDIKNLFQYV